MAAGRGKGEFFLDCFWMGGLADANYHEIPEELIQEQFRASSRSREAGIQASIKFQSKFQSKSIILQYMHQTLFYSRSGDFFHEIIAFG